MATVTFDGLWPNVQPKKSSQSLVSRLVASQERRAQYRIAMMYDAKTLRSMGMDDAAIKRLMG